MNVPSRIVVPQHVALFHVLVGDVGDVDVQPAVVVVVGDVDVHALLGVEADGLFGDLAEGAVAVVEERCGRCRSRRPYRCPASRRC